MKSNQSGLSKPNYTAKGNKHCSSISSLHSF